MLCLFKMIPFGYRIIASTDLPGVTTLRLSLLYNFLFILSAMPRSPQRDAAIPKESKF